MIKNIVLDIGNVLVDWNPKGAMRELGFSEEMVQKVAAATVETDFWNEADRGVLSSEEILEEFHKRSPELREEIDLFWNHVELSLHQFSYTKDWIRSMKEQGFQVYILSNYGDWTYRKTKEKALDFLPLVDGAILSYTVKQIKPNADIYQTLLSRFGLTAEESVFIDDRLENVEGAKREGIHGIHFCTIEQVRKELEAYGCR